MSNVTYKLFTDKMGGRVAANYIGVTGDIFYDPAEGALRMSDGSTTGGSVISMGTEPTEYRGFYAGFNSFYGDDPSVQQIIISKSATAGYASTTINTDNDDFYAQGLEGSSIIVALNVYGSSNTTALTTPAIRSFVQAFVDAVLYNGETPIVNIDDIKTAFYDNIDNLIASRLPAESLYENFQFLAGDVWPTSSIDDGGNDQYDNGNFLNTNLGQELAYNDGNPVYESGAVNGGDYVVLYKNSIFAFVATNADISKFYYSGGMGADGRGAKVVRALFGTNNLTANLGNLRIADWGYPGDTPVRLTNQHRGESIFLQSSDQPEGNSGRSGIRWHIRNEPNGPEGSKYSQVVVDNQGTRINNSDWSGSEGVWDWNFDDHGVTRLPQLSTNGGGSIIDGNNNIVVALDTEGNKIIGDSSNQEIAVGPDESHQIPNFSGMVMVNDHYDGGVELWICGGTGAVLVSSTRPDHVGTMAMNGSGYAWTNPASAALNGPFTFTVIKTRNGA